MSAKQCCKNPPTLNPKSGEGKVLQLGGLSCYACGPADSKIAVILISDVFGYEAPKLRKIADNKVSAAGFYTIVPDFFHGDPYISDDNVEKSFLIWLSKHPTDQGFGDARVITEALKSKGIARIGAAGFCWGAFLKSINRIPRSQGGCGTGQGRKNSSRVLLHPSYVTVEEFRELKVPISVLGAETDQMSPKELVEQFKVALDAKPEVDGFVKIFPGVSHGWCIRYNDEDDSAVKKAEEAHNDMLYWFDKHLK